MKRLTLLLIILAVTIGCNKQTEQHTTTNKDLTILTQASEKIINTFQRSLKGELMTAMKAGGATNAITVCQQKASEIASTQSTNVYSIRRVALKNRNTNNKASQKEAEILERFAKDPKMGSFTVSDFSKDSSSVYQYYKPIKTGKFCLKCHGPVESLDDDVKSVLTEAYPNDNATGHTVGDLRGMFVVDIKWPEAREVVTALLADSI